MMNPHTSVSDPGSAAGDLSLLRRCAGGVSLEQEMKAGVEAGYQRT